MGRWARRKGVMEVDEERGREKWEGGEGVRGRGVRERKGEER